MTPEALQHTIREGETEQVEFKTSLLNFNCHPQAKNKMLAKAFKLIGKVEK